MSPPALSGRCHCGNLSLTFHAAREPAELGARACQCSFCRARRLRWTADPDGRVELAAADPALLSRYRFGTATADFLICRRCGQVAAAVTTDEPEPRAVINVDLLDRAGEFTDAGVRDFDGEDLDARHRRRAQHWTPARLELGASAPRVVPAIELWFEFASTYSYLTAMRIEALAAATGARLIWRSFLLGPIFQAQFGTADSPFNLNPPRGRHMWRDMERLCARYGLPFRRPSQFPRASLLAARVALLAEDEPWIGRFVRDVFTANFAEDRDIARPEVIREILEAASLPADAWIRRAGEAEAKQRLRQRTEEAAARGVFGAPTFFVDGELFWGNDRLEDALAWATARPEQGRA